MFTCALYNCSIVVNTDSQRFVLSCAPFRCAACDDIGALLRRIGTRADDANFPPLIDEGINLCKSLLLLLSLTPVTMMGEVFFSVLMRILIFCLLLSNDLGLALIGTMLKQGI